jgi:tetraprenyl-beta-curcumene synthase
MAASASRAGALTAAGFAAAAYRYWLQIYPCVQRESSHWRDRALAIPDPRLRGPALEAQMLKRGNVEGSAALAAFAPRAWRPTVTRAQIAYQSIYDYTDTLAELANESPIANARQLHQALLVATDPTAHHTDYYAHYPAHDDGGYLQNLVETCRAALHALPAYQAIQRPAQRFTRRIVAYQSLNLTESQGGHRLLRRWATTQTQTDTDLRWWETAASAGSSLGLFALIAAAADPSLTCDQATAIERAFWPWIGALHSLLDSVTDQDEDDRANQRSLLSYYQSTQDAAARLHVLARESAGAASELRHPAIYLLTIAAMGSHYTSTTRHHTPTGRAAARAMKDNLGTLSSACDAIFLLRRQITRLRASGRERSP